jgi:hypothetical protein
MENYLAILLLIVPGYIARKIYKHTNDVRDDLSTFEETLYCLMFSGIISIVALTIMVISIHGCYFDYSTLHVSDIQLYANNLGFIGKYVGLVLIVTTILGLSTYWLNIYYTYCVNMVRGTEKAAVVLNQSIFDSYFNDGKYQHFVEVYKDGTLLCRGRLNSNVEKYKELGIEPCENGIKDMMVALKMKQPRYKKIYYDGIRGILIKEFDFPDVPIDS